MSNTENQQFFDGNVVNNEIPAWKSLENVIRGWVALSGWEKDLAEYDRIKKQWQD